jgi:hypothetical protein
MSHSKDTEEKSSEMKSLEDVRYDREQILESIFKCKYPYSPVPGDMFLYCNENIRSQKPSFYRFMGINKDGDYVCDGGLLNENGVGTTTLKPSQAIHVPFYYNRITGPLNSNTLENEPCLIHQLTKNGLYQCTVDGKDVMLHPSLVYSPSSYYRWDMATNYLNLDRNMYTEDGTLVFFLKTSRRYFTGGVEIDPTFENRLYCMNNDTDFLKRIYRSWAASPASAGLAVRFAGKVKVGKSYSIRRGHWQHPAALIDRDFDPNFEIGVVETMTIKEDHIMTPTGWVLAKKGESEFMYDPCEVWEMPVQGG